MARGMGRNVPLGQPFATHSASGRVGCYVLVPDPRFRGRRARRVCNSACGLPAKKPSARCSMGGVSRQFLPRGSQAQTFLPQNLLLGGY